MIEVKCKNCDNFTDYGCILYGSDLEEAAYLCEMDNLNNYSPIKGYCYSWDGEHFYGEYLTVEDALNDARLEDSDKEEVWIGKAVVPELIWFSNEEEIIESIYENLGEVCGDAAENFDISLDEENALAYLIDETVKKWIKDYNIVPNCYSVIDVSRYDLT